MSLSLLLLASRAMAISPAVEALNQSQNDPRLGNVDASIACAPIGRLLEGLNVVGKKVASTTEIPPRGAALLALGEPGAAAAAGFDPSGALRVGLLIDERDIQWSMPFVGTAEQVDALLSSLGDAPTRTAQGWALKGGMNASLAQGQLMVSKSKPRSGDPVVPDPALFAGLPDVAACAGWMTMPEELAQKSENLIGSTLSFFVPISRDGDILVRVKSAEALPTGFDRTVASPVGGFSTETPTVLVGLGVSPFDIGMKEGGGPAALKDVDINKIRKRFNIGAGATFAVFGDPRSDSPDWVVVLPIDKPASATKIAKRARKGVKKMGGHADKTGKLSFSATVKQTAAYAEARDGRLIVASRADRALEAADGVGASWLEHAPVERLQTWPVSVWTASDNFALDLGLRAVGGVMEMGLHVQMPEGKGADGFVGAMMQGLMAAGAGVAQSMNTPPARWTDDEVGTVMDGLWEAETARVKAGQPLLALPPSPRPAGNVDAGFMPWNGAANGWSEIGWAPGGPLRGSYWVELGKAGEFTVHAVIDEDGDGESAHFTRDQSGAVKTLSAPSVR